MARMDDLPPDVTEREDARWKADVILVLVLLAAVLLLGAVVHNHGRAEPPPSDTGDVGQPAR